MVRLGWSALALLKLLSSDVKKLLIHASKLHVKTDSTADGGIRVVNKYQGQAVRVVAPIMGSCMWDQNKNLVTPTAGGRARCTKGLAALEDVVYLIHAGYPTQ